MVNGIYEELPAWEMMVRRNGVMVSCRHAPGGECSHKKMSKSRPNMAKPKRTYHPALYIEPTPFVQIQLQYNIE